MPAEEVHLDDVGTLFEAQLKEANQIVPWEPGSDTVTFRFLKPSGLVEEKPGTASTDGSDGRAQYAAEDGLLNETGGWKLQVRIDYLDGRSFSSDVKAFRVYPNV